MDFSTMAGQQSVFGNSAFGASAAASTIMSTQGAPDKNKEKRFYDWHQKQGISAPQDYGMFASQPAPFSSVPRNPNQPTAASPFLQKVLTQQAVNAMNGGGPSNDDAPDGRRKPSTKRTASSPPNSPGGVWPKQMFGTRPPSRTRSRTSSTPDISGDIVNEDNAPPLSSIYDSYAPAPAPVDSKPSPPEPTMTPTQVRVANFSEDRFPDLIRALRRYYGPILEAYSALPESESKFSDPEIVPRALLDLETIRKVQPMSGREGGPGPWVRITFRDKEAAERAVEGSARGQLEVGGRTVLISMWENDSPLTELPFLMDIEPTPTPALTLRRLSSAGQRRPSIYEDQPAAGADGAQLSELMPGAKLLVPKQVEFAKKEGWVSGWANSLIGAGGVAKSGGASKGGDANAGWGSTVGRTYRYVMDEVVGFKYL